MDFFFLDNAFHNVIPGEDLPEGAVLVSRMPEDGETWDVQAGAFAFDLPHLKLVKRNAVKALRASKEQGLCSTPSGVVQIDDASKIKINGMATMATIAKSAGQPFSVGFILADNTVATLDADGAITMSLATGTYVSELYGASVALFAQIEAAADKAALDAIDITVGWP